MKAFSIASVALAFAIPIMAAPAAWDPLEIRGATFQVMNLETALHDWSGTPLTLEPILTALGAITNLKPPAAGDGIPSTPERDIFTALDELYILARATTNVISVITSIKPAFDSIGATEAIASKIGPMQDALAAFFDGVANAAPAEYQPLFSEAYTGLNDSLEGLVVLYSGGRGFW
jgi:hypothetical protein